MAEDGIVKCEVTRTTACRARACSGERVLDGLDGHGGLDAQGMLGRSSLEASSCCRFTAAACFRGACTPATAGDAKAGHTVDQTLQL
jgi:hypothetical protein